jgi:signal peptidase I
VTPDGVVLAPVERHAIEPRPVEPGAFDQTAAFAPPPDRFAALPDAIALEGAPIEPGPGAPAEDVGSAEAAPAAAAVAATAEPAGPSAWERLGEEVLTWFKTLASAAVYATLIVTFVCQVARVEGHSMSPTLEDEDRLIVNKLIYRLTVPQRDDIVMLYYPVNPDKSFVKRVIAKEGDVVRIVDGKVYVNGEAREDVFVPPTYRSHEDFGSQTIKQGYYFVMGDHRNNSSDSREWGEVPRKYIIGKVQLRWWPLSSARIFY